MPLYLLRYYREIILVILLGTTWVLRKELRVTRAELVQAKTDLEQAKKDMVDSLRLQRDLSKKSSELEVEKADLVKKLTRPGKKSISDLAKKKKGLVEKAINNGTAKVLKCIEDVTSGKDC